jgi:hypothetical protein
MNHRGGYMAGQMAEVGRDAPSDIRARSAILGYRKDGSPIYRIAGGATGAILTSTADTAGFIPQIWAQRALDILRANITLTKLVARDTDFEAGWRGKTLNIPYPGTFTANKKTADNPTTLQLPVGGATVAVTLDQHAYVDWLVEDIARAMSAQGAPDLIDRYIEGSVIALVEQLETDLFALYSTGGIGSVGTYGTDISAATIRSARKALNDLKVPQAGRSLTVSTKDEIALLSDTTLQTYFAFARPDAVAEGSIGSMYGFDIYVSQLVPTTAGTPLQTNNMAMSRNGFIFASRPFTPALPGSGVREAQVTDPLSGVSIRFQVYYSMVDRAVRAGFDILYGVKALRTNHAVLVKS